MTAALLVPVLSAGLFQPSPLDLVETELMLGWSELPWLFETRTLVGGQPPMLRVAAPPHPPWGGTGGVEIRSPLESGLWGSGGWTVEYSDLPVPDSTFDTLVGLMENTRGRNRYTGVVSRPLPAGLGICASLGMADTVTTQLARLERGGLSVSGYSWQGVDDAYSARLGLDAGALAAAAGISSPAAGERFLEALLEFGTRTGSLSAGAAVGASRDIEDPASDSLSLLEAHARVALDLGSVTAMVRADGIRAGDSTRLDPAAGLLLRTGGPLVGAGWTADGPMATASWGPAGVEVSWSDDGRPAAGAHLAIAGLGRVSAGWTADSARVHADLLPGFRWGLTGRVMGGGRMTLETEDGSWSLAMDLCAAFTLRTFTLAGALEDVLDADVRRGTFGISWSFSDELQRDGEEGRDR